MNPTSTHAEFTRLAAACARSAYNQAFRMVGNRDDALDMTQEASVRAWRAFASYDRRAPFLNWYARIISNVCIDLLRERGRRMPPLSVDAPLPVSDKQELRIDFADVEADPLQLLMSREMSEGMYWALAHLPEPFRRTLLLRAVDGCSYDEIGAIMHTNVGTVRSRLHRGKVFLREALCHSR